MKRTENGKAVLTTKAGAKVVAADALAKLSGVSGGAVVKVLAALRIMEEYETARYKHPFNVVAELVLFENVPQAQADAERSTATVDYCAELSAAFGLNSDPYLLPVLEKVRITA